MSTMTELQMPAAVRPIDLYTFFLDEINKVNAPLDDDAEAAAADAIEEDHDDGPMPEADRRPEAGRPEAGRPEAGRPETGPSASVSEAAREEGRMLLRRWTRLSLLDDRVSGSVTLPP